MLACSGDVWGHSVAHAVDGTGNSYHRRVRCSDKFIGYHVQLHCNLKAARAAYIKIGRILWPSPNCIPQPLPSCAHNLLMPLSILHSIIHVFPARGDKQRRGHASVQ
jgi:hypothetical protein